LNESQQGSTEWLDWPIAIWLRSALLFFLLSLHKDLKKPCLGSPPSDLCIRIFIRYFSQSEHALLPIFRESKI
jgi:hypothetical protein